MTISEEIQKEINTGCWHNITNEVYHADKKYISRSSLMDFQKSPYTYWAKHLNPNRPIKESTPAMILGSAFHTMILEPDKFKEEFIVSPEPVLLKDVGRSRYDAYKESLAECELTSKIVVGWETYTTLRDMRDVLRENKEAVEILKDARIENSFFWQDEHSGLYLKCRPDALQPNMIIDLKTTSDASPRAFQNEMVKFGYHVQFAMIRDAVEAIEGTRINNFINIVIETKYPYNMAIYLVDEAAINEGHYKYKQLCLDMKAAIAEDKWIDYGIQQISLPKWA